MAGSSVPLVDCHLHLQDPTFGPHVREILDRAIAAGVCRMVCNGTGEDDWPAVAQLARDHEQIVPCFGVHPWYVGQRSERWQDVLERCLDSMPSAVGEIGLDRWIEPRDEAAQEEVFRTQLGVARRRGLPVMIHCLRAWGWLMDVLCDEPPLPVGMLIHAYGGPVEMIQPLAERGAYFSFAGNVFEARRLRAREALAAVPLDRLLLETDSPDMLPPEPFRRYSFPGPDGKGRNVPGNLPAILHGVAQLRGQSDDALAKAVWGNAERLLGGLLRG